MAGQRRTPTQERGQVTQRAVVEGASRVFDRIGFGGASLSMIAEASGISQGAMYFHFKSKDQIALAVIHEQHARSLPLMAEIERQNDGVIDKLIHISRGMVGQLQEDATVRAGIRLAMEKGTLGEPAAEFYEDWIAGTAAMLKPALDSGELDSPLQPAELARTLIAFFTGVQLTSQATTERDDLLASVRNMWALLIEAIVPAPGRAQATITLNDAFVPRVSRPRTPTKPTRA